MQQRAKLYTGGPILTMEGHEKAEAVLTRDGVIAAVGRACDLRAIAPDAETVPLDGRAMLPAFSDPHSHLTALASSLDLCPLGAVTSPEGLAETLRAYCAERALPEGAWVVGVGYDHNELPGGAHPTRALLDEACPGHPVVVTHANGHMGVASTLALAAMGITPDTPDPEGGRIGREADGRTPNGYLEEKAFMAYATSALAGGDPAAAVDALVRAQQVYLSHGIALVQDGMTGRGQYELLSAAAAGGRLRLRTVGYVDLKNDPELSKTPHWQTERGNFSLGGYKIFLDGSPQGRTAWMLEPYAGDPDYRGYPIYTDEEVTAFAVRALEEGVQLLAHCNGDAAAAQYLRCLRAAQARTGKPAAAIRPVMIHAQLARREQLVEMRELGVIPSFFAAHTWYWGDVHRRNFGPGRAADISPLRWAEELGLPYTLHQDSPVIAPDMLESVWCAVDRVTRSGAPIGPEQRVDVWSALRAVTINAAYQYGMEGERGTIAPGKRADFVLLSADPTAVEPAAVREIAVEATIVADRPLYRRKQN